MRTSRAVARLGWRGTAQTAPAPTPRFTSVPTAIRATTRRVRGSTRSTAASLVALSQTEPKATWALRPRPSASATVSTTRGPGARARRAGVRDRPDRRGQRGEQDGGGEPERGRAAARRGRDPRRRPDEPVAPVEAQGGLMELRAQAGRDVGRRRRLPGRPGREAGHPQRHRAVLGERDDGGRVVGVSTMRSIPSRRGARSARRTPGAAPRRAGPRPGPAATPRPADPRGGCRAARAAPRRASRP